MTVFGLMKEEVTGGLVKMPQRRAALSELLAKYYQVNQINKDKQGVMYNSNGRQENLYDILV
jgi:hypothetical protein